MEVSGAKALITVDGARRKGNTAPVKQAVDQTIGDLQSLEHIIVVRHTGIGVPMRDGRDVFYDELIAAADPVCLPEPMEVNIRCSFSTRQARPRSRRESCTRAGGIWPGRGNSPVRVCPER